MWCLKWKFRWKFATGEIYVGLIYHFSLKQKVYPTIPTQIFIAFCELWI